MSTENTITRADLPGLLRARSELSLWVPRNPVTLLNNLIAQAKAAPDEGWIAVADELPELDVPVWMLKSDGSVFIGVRATSWLAAGWLWANSYGHQFADGKWEAGEFETGDGYEPIYWQPLPAAPVSALGDGIHHLPRCQQEQQP